jgi:hypothetical protein
MAWNPFLTSEDGAAGLQSLSRGRAALVLAAVTVAMFADVLFWPGERILSQAGTDISHQFLYWRQFAVDQMRSGNLPLWNPHLFSGAPFFGGFQSALLYPPHLLFLILPLGKAINAVVALHIFLLGFFLYLWISSRGLHPAACLSAAVLGMFCGPVFLHIYAGHLPNLCTMAWAPLVFFALDGMIERRWAPSCLIGSIAVSMQIYAGHPQYVYYTGVAAAAYLALRLVRSDSRLKTLAGFAVSYAVGAALGAVQILSGMDAAAESVRSLGVSYTFASSFSLPPENLITLVAPSFFGDMTNLPYWGRCYLWEMSLFFGVTGLTLALFGMLQSDRPGRRTAAAMVILLAVLALGAHTPIHRLLYDILPGFDKFRGASKFAFFASLFACMLAAMGMDRLIRFPESARSLLRGVLPAAAVLALGGLFLLLALPQELWTKAIAAVSATGETYLPEQVSLDPLFASSARQFSALGLLFASAVALLAALILKATLRTRNAVYLVVLLACLEIFVFARTVRPTFVPDRAGLRNLTAFFAARPGDYRILNPFEPNSALSTGARDIWGYDPGVPLRYARFVAYTQGEDPDKATQYVKIHQYHPWFRMLRCRYAFSRTAQGLRIHELPDVLPRLMLVQNWIPAKDMREAFAVMSAADFDPRAAVVLEEKPDPEPTASASGGSIEILDSSTDHLTVFARLASPSILLLTDSYSSGWRARGLAGSAQEAYRILPADYTLMAVPLSAGSHRLRIEYAPPAFRIGAWISLTALVTSLVIIGTWWLRHRRREKETSP